MLNNYDRIADLYDLYVTADYDLAFWEKECSNAGEVLEVTAGTGRVTLPLLRAGVRITAVDVSLAQLKQLRDKAATTGLAVETVRADMRDFDLGRTFPLVIIPFQSLEELTEACDVTAALRCVHAHLDPAGRAIITLHRAAKQNGREGNSLQLVNEWELKNGNRMLFWLSRNFDPDTGIGRNYQLYEEYDVDGILYKKRLFSPRYHVYDEEDIRTRIASAGLRVTNTWGGYDHSPLTEESSYMIFELRV